MGGKPRRRAASRLPEAVQVSVDGLVELLGVEGARRAAAGDMPGGELIAADPEVRMGPYLVGCVHAYALVHGLGFDELEGLI